DVYLGDAVSLLSPGEVIELAGTSAGLIGQRRNWCSARVIESASAQFPDAFAVWREAILDSVPLERVGGSESLSPNVLYMELGPIWRGSHPELLDRIEKIARDPTLTGGTRRTFAGLIFQSEDWSRIERMMNNVPMEGGERLYDPNFECLQSGFEMTPA